jgi:putative intracellular protease/amidase
MAAMGKGRVLVVATSHGRMGASGEATGVWLEELETPYYVLLDAGAEVTLASVRGGEIPFDPRSVSAPSGTASSGEEPAGEQELPPSVHRFLADGRSMAVARDTPAVGDVDGAMFDAVFLPGGHGAMWDLPESGALARLVGALFDQGRVVAAVCHGPAGLVSARRRDGRPIVEGREVTAFTNSEERAVGLDKIVPFLLEDWLEELGARFVGGPDWQPHAVRHGNLITGQNPQSSELVARHVLEALGEAA